jgi:hypothetical protein
MALGVEYGERLGRRAMAYASLSYLEDLMNPDIGDDLAQVSRTLTTRTGRTWNLQGSDRGIAFIFGAKATPIDGRVRPYIGGGVGALGLRRRITDRMVGDVTEATLAEFGIGDAQIAAEKITRPLGEAAFGVSVEVGRTHLDIGYRYRRVFHFESTPNFSQLALGIGVNFEPHEPGGGAAGRAGRHRRTTLNRRAAAGV